MEQERHGSRILRVLNGVMVLLGIGAGGLALCAALLVWQGYAPSADLPAEGQPSLSDPAGMEDAQAPQPGEENQSEEMDPARGMTLAEQGDWSGAVEILAGVAAAESEDPAVYETLARAYRELGEDTRAAETLRMGLEITGAEELENPLKAAESTVNLPQAQRELLDSLYQAFAGGDEAAFQTALQAWENASDYAQETLGETKWVRVGSLAWDGQRFWGGYTGLGMAFWGTGIYYGELTEGKPDGTGRSVQVHTGYPEGAVEYLQLDARWEDGVAVGDVVFRNRDTQAGAAFAEYDIVGTLDGTDAEVITTAEVTVYADAGGAGHQYAFSIRDGHIVQDGGLTSDGGLSRNCTIHSGCGSHLIVTADSLNTLYQNPYPWGREGPYTEPWMAFMNFSYTN